MLTQFLFANIHFILTVFVALVFFATGWLYLDSWSIDKSKKTPLIRAIGFFLLALSSIIHATLFQLPLVASSIEPIAIIGLLLILLSLSVEPYLKPPVKLPAIIFFNITIAASVLYPISTALLFLIAVTYLRKNSEGYEKQLKLAGIAFLFLALSKLMNIAFFWADSQNVFWFNFLATYGTYWTVTNIIEFIGASILGIWVFGYIRFRMETQIYIIMTMASIIIFTATTFLFTFLLLKNIESNTLSSLETDTKVIQYSLERLQYEAMADAKTVAGDTSFQNAYSQKDNEELYKIITSHMLSQNTNFITIATNSGEVIMRSEDKDNKGDNILTSPVVKSALSGAPLSTIEIAKGPILSKIQIIAATPIKDHKESGVQGVLITGFTIDDAFVDGMKTLTGLDVAVFAGNTRIATTFTTGDGKSRFTGTSESNNRVLNTVLKNNKTYLGTNVVLNQPFYTAYSPLNTHGGETIGMLFVGKVQNKLLETAQESFSLTFLGTICIILLSLLPLYFLSRYIYNQMKA